MPRLLVVDGHAYAYRAFHAIRELNGPEGSPTNAIYGFIKMVGKMQAKLSPTHAAVIWDGGLAPERMSLLPEYKAQRPPMPPSLQRQLDEIVAWLQAMRLTSWCQDGIEADDWIASLARRAAAQGWSVVIASSDKDFMQLVSERIGLLNPGDKSETVWTAEQVRSKTGVAPSQIVDWLSLIGDVVDNIPGVPGVGPKTATALLEQFGSVDALYERLAEVRPERLRNALSAARADVDRNRQLIRLNDAVTLPGELESLALNSPDVAALSGQYGRWGFRSMLAELSAKPAQGDLF